MSLLAPENLKQPVADRIVMLVNAGHDEAAIFKDIYAQCQLKLTTRAARQRLADHIAQISAIDVFATGQVPDGLEELES